MKASELRELRGDALDEKLDVFEKKIFSLRSQAVTEKIENVRAIGNVKRDIARVKTVMKERQLKGQ